jgi:hypothetical protein
VKFRFQGDIWLMRMAANRGNICSYWEMAIEGGKILLLGCIGFAQGESKPHTTCFVVLTINAMRCAVNFVDSEGHQQIYYAGGTLILMTEFVPRTIFLCNCNVDGSEHIR